MVTSPQAKRAEAWATGMGCVGEVMTNQAETQVVLGTSLYRRSSCILDQKIVTKKSWL